jgi:hypothetical protein
MIWMCLKGSLHVINIYIYILVKVNMCWNFLYEVGVCLNKDVCVRVRGGHKCVKQNMYVSLCTVCILEMKNYIYIYICLAR